MYTFRLPIIISKSLLSQRLSCECTAAASLLLSSKYQKFDRPNAKFKSNPAIKMLSNGREDPGPRADSKVETAQSGCLHQDYLTCMKDLGSLLSNSQTIALKNHSRPKDIIPLFTKHLELSGISVQDLNKLPIVHVSGTKGKGSTCAFIDSILRASGRRVGFYNSPHLVRVNERIKIDGLPIDDERFNFYFRRVFDQLTVGTKKLNISMPSYFSFLTILAFHVFIGERVDGAIIEVGIGGEYDPTNAIPQPVACGITTLDLDHTDMLGDTIEDIAWTKAGIAKPGAPLFTVEQEYSSVIDVIRSRAQERSCPLYICKALTADANLPLGIKGTVQYKNAALACQLAKYFLERSLDDLTISSGHSVCELDTNLDGMEQFYKEALRSCNWPGRCQILRLSKINYFLDGAHTSKSMANCIEWFAQESDKFSPEALKVLAINIIGTRDKRSILEPLSRYSGFDTVIFTSNRINHPDRDPPKPGSLSSPNDKNMENVVKNMLIWKDLVAETDGCKDVLLMSNVTDCVDRIEKLSANNPDKQVHVLVTGSLHLVGSVTEALETES